MPKVLHGKINGRTIELSEDLGLAPGADVEVQVKPVPAKGKWGDGIMACAGALADDPEWYAIMAEIYQARKLERRPLPEDE